MTNSPNGIANHVSRCTTVRLHSFITYPREEQTKQKHVLQWTKSAMLCLIPRLGERRELARRASIDSLPPKSARSLGSVRSQRDEIHCTAKIVMRNRIVVNMEPASMDNGASDA